MVLVRPYLLGVDPDDIGHDALADVGSGEPSTGLRRRPRKTTSESDVTRTGVASSEIKPTESDEHTAEDSCKDDFPAQSSRHPDEHQIKLDTDRSFVLYPVGTHKHSTSTFTYVSSCSSLNNSRTPCKPRGTSARTQHSHHICIPPETPIELFPGAFRVINTSSNCYARSSN